jgi:hypothetical protein
MGAGVQYVGGMLFPLTSSGEVPLERQKANEIGSSVVPAQPAVTAAANHATPRGSQQVKLPSVVDPAIVKSAMAEALSSKNVVKLAKARRRELAREIARLKKLEPELAALDRLIAAADGKPIAVVRDITKRSAG